MDEILKTQGTVSFSLDEKDVEKYARNLKEFEELRNLEKQFSETYSDLMETKTKLSFLESEIKATREEEERKKSRMEELFDSGETKEKGGLLEEAIELYLEVLSLEPKNVRAIYHIQKIKTLMKQKENERFQKEQEAKKRAREVQDLLESGKRFYREGQFERALEEFQSAVSLGGKQPEALKYAEECEQRIREINEILNKAKKESEEKKRLLHEWMVTANTHLRMEEYEQAIGFLEKALLLMPDNKEVQETLSKAENQFREKKKVLEKARAEGEEKLRKIREWQLKAQDCLNNKDQSKAVSYLEQILILDPHREEILREIKCIHDAMMQAEKEEKSKSEREKKELEDREFQIRDNYVMGIQYFMTGQYQQAVGCFTVVMKLNPNYEELELYMKRVEERLLAEEEQKRLDLQKEREWNVKKREMEWEAKQKREAEVRDFFESALKFLSQGDYLQAVTILEKCYAMDPSNPAILVELEKARAKLEEKNKREEADRIKEAEKQEKERQVQKQIVFIREQAEIYFNENEFEKSIKEWEKIMEFDLLNRDARSGISRCEKELKRIYEEKQREQREKQERLEKVEKANVEADSLFKGNQIDEALRKWNEVLNLDPFNKKAQEGICLAQGRLREIRACEESKFRVLRWIEEEEGRLIQLKNKMRTGFQLYQEGEFRKALDTWNELGNEK